jgi:hypothetical protein
MALSSTNMQRRSDYLLFQTVIGNQVQTEQKLYAEGQET